MSNIHTNQIRHLSSVNYVNVSDNNNNNNNLLVKKNIFTRLFRIENLNKRF